MTRQDIKIAEKLDTLTALIQTVEDRIVHQYFPVVPTATNKLVLGHLDMAMFHLNTAKEMLTLQQFSEKDIRNSEN